MTAFEFMVNSFYFCVGVACLSVASLVMCGVAIGVHRAIKGKKREK